MTAHRSFPRTPGFRLGIYVFKDAEIAPTCRISHARVVDAGRIVTAGGIASGMEMGFHLLRRAGYGEDFVADVARVMEYAEAYRCYSSDIEYAA